MRINLSLTTRLVLRLAAVVLPVLAMVAIAMVIEYANGERLHERARQHDSVETLRAEFVAFSAAIHQAIDSGQLGAEAPAALKRSVVNLANFAAQGDASRRAQVAPLQAVLGQLVARLDADQSGVELNRLHPDIDAASSLVEEILRAEDERFDKAVESFLEQGTTTRRTVSALLVVVALGVVWFSLQTARRFAVPLSRATALAARISAGEKVDNFIVDPRRDVGTLLTTMRRMQQNIERYRQESAAHEAGLRANLAELAASRANLEEASTLAQIGNWDWDLASGERQWSRQLCINVGIDPDGAAPSLRSFLRTVPGGDRQRLIGELRVLMAIPGERSVDHSALVPGAKSRVLLHRARSECDERGRVVRVHGTVQDISERRRASEEIHRRTLYDSLTRLPNRALLTQRLQAELGGPGKVAVLFINIDRFRRINASLGHATGDLVLASLAQRLVDTTRAISAESEAQGHSGFVARFGGDEFVVVMAGLDGPRAAAGCARRLVAALTAPLLIEGHDLVVAVHIGIAVGHDDAADAAVLVGHAATACSLARQSGLNMFRFFTTGMNAATAHRLEMEIDLRHAIANGDQFFLEYQPKVEMDSGLPVGVEALIRWHHPVRGVVMPGQFIALAEELDLLVPISGWVIDEVCVQLARWRAAGINPVPVAINLSGTSFRNRRLSSILSETCARHGVSPALITIEITETMLMDQAIATRETLAALHDVGFRLSVDDFGTGYSSLAYLHRFPIDELKIDRSFVSELGAGNGELAIAATIIALGQNLGMDVIAEGVETVGQARALRRLGCRLMQGYLFSRPAAPEAIGEMLRSGKRLELEDLEEVAG